MAISLLDNLNIRKRKQNVERDAFNTLADMKAYNENYLPDVFISLCYEDKCLYKFDRNNTIDEITGKWRKFETGGSGTAENTIYTNENFPQYDNVDSALDALFNKVYYVKPTCSLSATPSGGIFEMGTTISAPITFNWTTNKDITSQTLTYCILENTNVRTATYNTDVTSDKTFTLSISDGENSASSSVIYKFLNNIFWGSAVEPANYDSAFILGLANKKLSTSSKADYNFNCRSGEYAYWAVPASLTFDSVWVNGFQADIEKITTISFENSKGYSTNYDILRLGNEGLGSFTATVK